jgi:hypothetical protein
MGIFDIAKSSRSTNTTGLILFSYGIEKSIFSRPAFVGVMAAMAKLPFCSDIAGEDGGITHHVSA